MTILQAIQANPVFADLPAEVINFGLSNRSVDGSVVYSKEYLKDVELVSADLYLDTVSLLPDFKEGQLSVKQNVAELRGRAKVIYQKYNDDRSKDFEPKIINVGVRSVG